MDDGQVTLVWFVIWFAVNALIGFGLGNLRGSPKLGVLLAVLLGPIGWLVCLALADARRKCAECGGVVPEMARKCMHCGGALA